MRSRSVLLGLVLLSSACTPASDQTEAPVDPVPAEEALITSLPTDCRGIGRSYSNGEITFVSEGRLYASSIRGGRVRCLAEVDTGDRLEWGGTGDRVFIPMSGPRGRVIFSSRDRILTPDVPNATAFGLSRPTGTSVLYGSPNGRRLYKMPSNGGRLEEISFLKRHDEAIYHPAGEHIFVVGEDHRGRYGIFLATNLGTDPQLLVIGEDARRIFSLTFSPTGFLYYAAEHDDRYDVHGLSLSPTGTGTVDTSRLKTFFSTEETITQIVVSQVVDIRQIAIEIDSGSSEGCGRETLVWSRNKGATSVHRNPSRPIGWLLSNRLLYATVGADCESTEGLYTWGPERSVLVVDDVEAAAVRGRLPGIAQPPTRLPEVVA